MIKILLLAVFMVGCATPPTGRMVELPDGAIVVTAEEQAALEHNLTGLAMEMSRLRILAIRVQDKQTCASYGGPY